MQGYLILNTEVSISIYQLKKLWESSSFALSC